MEKNIQNHAKLSKMKELGGETGVLVVLGLPLTGRGTEAGVQSPHWDICLIQRKTFKTESETADLWQPKWNENQTVLAIAIHYPRQGHRSPRRHSGWEMELRDCGAIPG